MKYFLLRLSLIIPSLLLLSGKALCIEHTPKAIILYTEANSEWVSVGNKVSAVLSNGLYPTKDMPIEEFLSNQDILNNTDLLVIVPGFSLPSLTAPSIMEFIKRGGDLIAFGVPLWNNNYIWDGNRCIKPMQFVQEHFSSLVPNSSFITEENIKDWQRESNHRQAPVIFEYQSLKDIVPNQTLHGFHVSTIDMKGWDIFATPALENPFPNNYQVTVFFAKGSKATDYLTIEWREKDGSRWITSVPLSTDWQFYALTPDRFKLWEFPSRAGTSFNPQNAVKVCIGLTMSHSPIAGGRHEFWVAGLGTAPITPQHQILLQTTDLPKLELFYPEYKFYTSNDVRSISTDTELALKELAMSVPKQFLLIHPRPRGGGFDKHRSWRWIPLIHAWGKKKDYRGTISAMMIYNDEPYKNSVQTCFAIQEPEWYLDKQFIDYFSEWAKKLRGGTFLIDGGCAYYTVFPEQALPMGATIYSTSETDYSNASIQLLLRNHKGKLLWKNETPIQLSKQQISRIAENIPYPQTAGNNIRVECYLIVNGEKSDYVYHELNCWKP